MRNTFGIERRERHGHNRLAVVILSRQFPKVARSSQPWARGRNPFGIGATCLRPIHPGHASGLRGRQRLDRLKLEIGEVVPFAIVEGEQLGAGLREPDGANLGEVPLMIVRGQHRQAAGGGKLAIEVEGHRVRLEGVESFDAIRAGAGDIDGVMGRAVTALRLLPFADVDPG